MFEFGWDEDARVHPFNEEAYKLYRRYAAEATPDNMDMYTDLFLGCVRVGDLAFDIYTEGIYDRLSLYFKMYVGGIEGDYHGRDNYPYAYGGEGYMRWYDPSFSNIPSDHDAYERFKTYSTGDFLAFISAHEHFNDWHLRNKLVSQLHIW